MDESFLEISPNGDKIWKKLNGEFHNENGPAYQGSISKAWWINNKLHREDGPSIMDYPGRTREFWINHERIN